jgi:molybdate transport system substrate-binding protein
MLVAAGWLGCQRPGRDPAAVRAYVVHLVQAPFQKLAADFERESGVRVDAIYACRRFLHEAAAKNGDGDLYINSNRATLDEVRKRGLATGSPATIAELVPAIVVMKANPKQIATLADLAKPGVRVCLGDPKGCMGSVADQILQNARVADKVAPNVVLRAPGEFDLARSVDGKKIDAAIVWASVVLEIERKDVEIIPIPPEANITEPVDLLILDTGKNKTGATRLAAFLQTPKAQKTLAEARLKR